MGKLLIILLILVSVLIFFPSIIFARSGCCSHHRGVCGCGCCDGSPLLATCAPYYPNCSSATRMVPSKTPVPTYKPKPIVQPTANPNNQYSPQPTSQPSKQI